MKSNVSRSYVTDGSLTQHWICCVGKCNKAEPYKYYSVQHAEDEGWCWTLDTKYVNPSNPEAGKVCPKCVKIVEVLV